MFEGWPWRTATLTCESPLGALQRPVTEKLSASISIFPTPEAKSQIHFLLTSLIFLWLFGSRTFSKQLSWTASGGKLWEEPVFLLISAQLMEKVSMEALLSQVSLKGTCQDGKDSYRLFTMDQGSPDLSPLFSLVTTLHHHFPGNRRRT